MELITIVCLVASFLVFVGYLLGVYLKFGILPSISDSYRDIKNLGNGYEWLFSLALLGFSFPLMVIGGQIHFLFFLGTLLIMAVGTAPIFYQRKENPLEHWVHVIGAVAGIGAAVIGFMLSGMLIYGILLILAAGLVKLTVKKNTTWWVEVAMFLGVWLGLLIYYA